MIEFLAFTWLLSRNTWRERADEGDNLILTLFLVPVVTTLLFAYMVYCGLEDIRAGWLIRWTATVLSCLVVLAACLEGRWLVGLGIAFGAGLIGLGMVLVAGLVKAKAMHEEEPDESGPRWQFS